MRAEEQSGRASRDPQRRNGDADRIALAAVSSLELSYELDEAQHAAVAIVCRLLTTAVLTATR